MYNTDLTGMMAQNDMFINLHHLDMKTNKELLIKYNNATGDEKILLRNKIIEGNMGLVMKVASEYINRCQFLTFNDLCQEGAMGLFSAIEKFDINTGNAFSTYAYDWIKVFIQKSMAKYEHLIRKPSYLYKAEYIIKNAIEDAKNEGKPAPTYEELSKITDLPKNIVSSILDSYNIVYGDTPISEDSVIYDMVPSDFNVEEKVCENDEINELLDYLKRNVKNPKSLDMFLYRSGFADGVVHTLEETGKKFNVTKERVRFVEGRMYTMLRKRFLNNVSFLKAYGHRPNYIKHYNEG